MRKTTKQCKYTEQIFELREVDSLDNIDREVVVNIEVPNGNNITASSSRRFGNNIQINLCNPETGVRCEAAIVSIVYSDLSEIRLQGLCIPEPLRGKGIGTYLFSVWLRYIAQFCIAKKQFPSKIRGSVGVDSYTPDISKKLYKSFDNYSIEGIFTLHLDKEELLNDFICYTIEWDPRFYNS